MTTSLGTFFVGIVLASSTDARFHSASKRMLAAQQSLSEVLRRGTDRGMDWFMLMHQVGAVQGDEFAVKMLVRGPYTGFVIPDEHAALVSLELVSMV
jgi:hypothetical protein